jgi:hypothetical protein
MREVFKLIDVDGSSAVFLCVVFRIIFVGSDLSQWYESSDKVCMHRQCGGVPKIAKLVQIRTRVYGEYLSIYLYTYIYIYIYT